MAAVTIMLGRAHIPTDVLIIPIRQMQKLRRREVTQLAQRWHLLVLLFSSPSTHTKPSMPGATSDSSMWALGPLDQFLHQPHLVGVESGGLTGECCLTGVWVVRQSPLLAQDTC